MMPRLFIMVVLLAAVKVAIAAQVKLSIADSYNNEIVPDVEVSFNNSNSIFRFNTTSDGVTIINLQEGSYTVEVAREGYHSATYTTQVEGDGMIIMRFKIEPDFHELGEVTVLGKRYLTAFNDESLTYNLGADSRAQGRNLLSSLNLVPLLSTSANGEIEVKGNARYLIYLNGRPYHIAMADPISVLSSIKSDRVKMIEVVTDPRAKYGLSDDTPIINIITEHSALDGYYNTLRADGSSLPKAHGGDLFMAMKDKVRFSLSYDYDFNGQYHQPVETLTAYDSGSYQGATSHTSSPDGNSGNWQWHTARAIFTWDLDSIRSIYADVHAKIETSDFHDHLLQQFTQPDSRADLEWQTDTRSDVTSGEVEANAQFRQYFKEERNRTHYFAGYRYTYNPDRRKLHTEVKIPNLTPQHTYNSTDGGLHQHSLRYYQQAKLAYRHYLGWSAGANIRNGHTDSSEQEAADMRYTQNIYFLTLGYASSLFQRISVNASVIAQLEHFSMHNSEAISKFSKDYFYICPNASLTYYISRMANIKLAYSSSVKRPSIGMLNPYVEQFNPLTSWHGNPNLRQEIQNRLELSGSLYSQSYYLSLTIFGAIHDHAISPYYFADSQSGTLAGGYTNIASCKYAGAQYYASYSPIQWLRLSISGLFNHQWLRDPNTSLRQNDWEYHLNANCNIFLPHQWQISAKYGRHKGAPIAFATNTPFDLYTISAEKNFLKGSLTTGIFIDNAFGRYNHSRTVISAPGIATTTLRDIQIRGVGINITYTLSTGRKIDLKRDSSLAPADIDSGVR